MRSAHHHKRILAGYISRNDALGDGSNLAKFHSFIIKVNNSAYFWTITAGLYVMTLHLRDPYLLHKSGGHLHT